MTQTHRIILGLMLGFLAGVVFGPRMVHVAFVGDVFVGLLQMTVLPYIMVSLISAVASLSPTLASSLMRYAALVLGILWSITLFFIALAPLAFPDWESASLFSSTLLPNTQEFDYLAQFIPANIFLSLNTNAIPAVVLFSVLLGVALLHMPHKDDLLKIINTLQTAIGQIASMVMKTAPLGVFAIAANAAGTLDVNEIQGLYVYLVTLAVVCLILTFWVFPRLVTLFTKVHYRDVLGVSKEALLTAFATGNLLIVLPIIVEQTRKLFLLSYEKTSHEASVVEVIVPAAFSLPVAGKLMALLFILFAGWFTGDPVLLNEYPELLLGGLFSLFGSPVAVLPDMLAQYRISQETLSLYILSDNLIANRLGAMTSVMFITVFAILAASGVTGKWRWKPILVVRFFIGVVVVIVLGSQSLKLLYKVVGHDYTAYKEYISRELLLPAAPSRHLDVIEPAIEPITERTGLARITERGELRVGYYHDWLPYAFHNEQGRLVGLDVELWHKLARDLGVQVVFIRVKRSELQHLLDTQQLDLAAGLPVTPHTITHFNLTSPYIEEHLALLVDKKERAALSNWQTIADNTRLKLGVPNSYYLSDTLQKVLSKWDIEQLASPRSFLRGDKHHLDAVVYGAAGASAWTLVYPDYSVVVPQPALPPIPLAMPVASDDLALMMFVTLWLELQKKNGTIDQLSDYWIHGINVGQKGSDRWNLWDYWFKPTQEPENQEVEKN